MVTTCWGWDNMTGEQQFWNWTRISLGLEDDDDDERIDELCDSNDHDDIVVISILIVIGVIFISYILYRY